MHAPYRLAHPESGSTERSRDGMAPSDDRYVLYWSPGTCARVIYVGLEEIRLPYETTLVERSPGPPPEYFKVNPKGKVPALKVGDRILTENPAIQTFLA